MSRHFAQSGRLFRPRVARSRLRTVMSAASAGGQIAGICAFAGMRIQIAARTMKVQASSVDQELFRPEPEGKRCLNVVTDTCAVLYTHPALAPGGAAPGFGGLMGGGLTCHAARRVAESGRG